MKLKEDEAVVVFASDGYFIAMTPQAASLDPIPHHVKIALTLFSLMQESWFQGFVEREIERDPRISDKNSREGSDAGEGIQGKEVSVQRNTKHRAAVRRDLQ